MSESTFEPPEGGPRVPRPGASADALELTLRLGSLPLGTRVSRDSGDLLPDVPLAVKAKRIHGGWLLESPDGSRTVRGGDRVSLRHGDLEVDVAPVRQSRFARFSFDQGDAVLPTIMLAVSVLVLQVAFLWWVIRHDEEGGAQGFEPTPEYIARLLEGQFDGAKQGVIAKQAPRPTGGEAIENYYLQPGHEGPRDHIGGGQNVGNKVQDGDPKGKEARARRAEPTPPVGGDEQAPEQEVVQADQPADEEQDQADDGEDDEDRPIAVHVDEGWGLSDWYDTQDAREDAKEIERQLEMARQILRLNPDDPNGLTIKAYYQYLAFDYDAARRTYERFTTLYPDEPAGWNNLALVYKRKGEYEKEEGLYRVALGISPYDDHALNNLAVCLAHQGRYDEALEIMKQLETLTPDDPYADLHRAKIYAAMGKEDRSYRFLQKSLAGMRKLDTLHNIEFRQDIRVDPAFAKMRDQDRFRALLNRYYGDKQEGWWNRKRAPR